MAVRQSLKVPKLVMSHHRGFKQLYRPKIQMNFSKKDGRYHIYHSEGGEGYLKFLTRANVVCVGWASMLLGFELLNPFFGWWHGLSNSFMVIMGLGSSRMLHHYSTRMVNDMWIM